MEARAPPRWWQYLLPARCAGVDVLTEGHVTQNSTFETAKTSSTRTATGAVVEFIQTARLADFPAEALTIAKRCIVDGLGVMLAGSTQDAGRLLHEHVQASDPRQADPRLVATVFGPRPFKTGPASAALVNGTAGH